LVFEASAAPFPSPHRSLAALPIRKRFGRHRQAILNSPSYRRADNDIDFLAQDGVRGVRLQIDFSSPSCCLKSTRFIKRS
jgi:hypothetical protein